jgi:hypothetical protein
VWAGGYTADSEAENVGEGLPKYDGFAEVLVGTSGKTAGLDQGRSGVEFDRRFSGVILCQAMLQRGNLWQATGRVMRAPEGVVPLFFCVVYGEMAMNDVGLRGVREYVEAWEMELRGLEEYVPAAVAEACLGEVVEASLPSPGGEGFVSPVHSVWPSPEFVAEGKNVDGGGGTGGGAPGGE